MPPPRRKPDVYLATFLLLSQCQIQLFEILGHRIIDYIIKKKNEGWGGADEDFVHVVV